MRHIENIDRICACSCLFTTSHNQRLMFWTTYAPPRLQGPAPRIPKEVLEWIVKVLTSSERTAAWRGFQPASRAYGYTPGMVPTRPWAAPRKFEQALITLSVARSFWKNRAAKLRAARTQLRKTRPDPAWPAPPMWQPVHTPSRPRRRQGASGNPRHRPAAPPLPHPHQHAKGRAGVPRAVPR